MRYRHTINLFMVSLPICVLMRVIQLIFTIDSTTGFIKQQYSTIGLLITLIVCAAIAAVAMLAAATDGIKQNPVCKQPLIAVAAMVTGGMFLYQAIAGFMGQNTGAWHDVFLVFLNVASAVVFVAYGLKSICNFNMPTIILVIPVVYFIVRLISIFVSTSSLAPVTENVFMIFTNSVLLWFMFEFASFENNIGDAVKKPKRLFASGIAAVMLCATTSLPKIIYAMVNKNEVSHGDMASALFNAAIGLFVFLHITYNFGEKTERSKKSSSKHSA